MKNLEQFKEEIKRQCGFLSTKNERGCDCWKLNKFVVSPNSKFVAYFVNKIELIYRPKHEKKLNWIVVVNLETEEKRTKSSMKYYETGFPYYNDRRIESIIEVSDNGKVKYRTHDKKEHSFN
jgi:hypothetical protein